MTTKCPSCGQTFEVDASATGQTAPCPVCEKRFVISPLLVPKSPHNPRDSITKNDDAAIRMLIPVGRSGWAIASGYLGLVSVLGVFAPFAVFTGIMALRDIKKHPDKHGKGRAWFGIVTGGLATAVWGVGLVSVFVG